MIQSRRNTRCRPMIPSRRKTQCRPMIPSRRKTQCSLLLQTAQTICRMMHQRYHKPYRHPHLWWILSQVVHVLSPQHFTTLLLAATLESERITHTCEPPTASLLTVVVEASATETAESPETSFAPSPMSPTPILTFHTLFSRRGWPGYIVTPSM